MPQYICTGFDAFLTHEPDLFDAMALVAVRVRARLPARARVRARVQTQM
jgi:hypothetical protein